MKASKVMNASLHRITIGKFNIIQLPGDLSGFGYQKVYLLRDKKNERLIPCTYYQLKFRT